MLKWNRWLTGHQSTKMKLKYVETNPTKLSGNVKLQWKGLWLLTIYFDLGKPNTKSFQSMFSLNQLYFREIFLIRFACKNTNRKSDCNLEKKWTVWTWNLAFCSSNTGLILSQNVLKFFFNLQTAWHSPNALHTIIHGQVFRNMT